MVRLGPSPRRPARVALLAAILLALLAARAYGEEAFVLDNGSVIRGQVMREEGDAVEIRLSGRGMRGIVTVERSRIVQRFVTVDTDTPVTSPRLAPPPVAPAPATSGPIALAAVDPVPPRGPEAASPPASAAPGPSLLSEEGMVDRFVRRAAATLPTSPGSRTFLVGLALAVLTALVALGARMADIDDATLGRCTTVALLLGALIALSIASARALLRTDVAPLAVPVALLAWAGLAAAVFRCGFGRAFTLLAFVLLAGALVLFTTGVVLTAV